MATRRDVHDPLGAATRARKQCQAAGDLRGEAAALHQMAEAHATSGDFEDALQCADEALDLYLELKDKPMEAFELLSMAKWHLEKNDPWKALSDAEDALEIYQMIKSPEELAAMAVVFQAHMARGDTRKARLVAMDGLRRFQAAGDRKGEGEALSMLVDLYVRTEKFEQALNAGEQAREIFQELGDRGNEGKVLNLMAGVYLRTRQVDKAVALGQEALALLKQAGQSKDKSDALNNLVEAYTQREEKVLALEVASDMRNHFAQVGDTKGEANALLSVCNVQFQLEDWDQAVASATRAQALLGDEGDLKGEGYALRMLTEAHTKKGEHKAAIRAGERARQIFREVSSRPDEALALYLISQNAVQLAVREGARVDEEGRMARSARDALDKASKTAESAARIARELGNQPEILGCALSVLAQVRMMDMKPEESLKLADEAVLLFRDVGDYGSEAAALLMSADALRHLKQYQESAEAADEALTLYKHVEDDRGAAMAQEVLDWLQQVTAQFRQQMQQQQQQQLPQQPNYANLKPVNFADQPAAEMPPQAQSLARQAHERERGPALDLSAGVDATVIKNKVLEIALRITGAEDGDIEADTPLMEAGLTSNSAILLRDELSQELPGVSLPVTLVFDYPSIASMSELIVESSKRKALKR